MCAICGINAGAQGKSTVDEALQQLASRLLYAKQGSIIAIEPSTGEIKCLVSESYMADTINRAVGMEYSPGSTFKVAQALTLLNEKIINEQTSYACHKGFWRGSVHISCHPHRPNLPLIPAIGHSCNAFFCKSFMSMIKDVERYGSRGKAINLWHSYMQSMGLGAPLGVDIPGEKGGLIPDSAFLKKQHGAWNESTIMWVGMGQGEVMTTPVQLCNLAAMIANRGYYIIPHTKVYAPSDSLYRKYSEKHMCKAAPEVFETVVKGMRCAVTEGTGKKARVADYEVCGKTGTAENQGKDHSVFIGFAPKNNPLIAVAVYIENGGWGADLAAPIGGLIIEQALNGELSDYSEEKAVHWEETDVIPTEYERGFVSEDEEQE